MPYGLPATLDEALEKDYGASLNNAEPEQQADGFTEGLGDGGS